MIPIVKLMLVLATVLGVVTTINSKKSKGQKRGDQICVNFGSVEKLKNASQEALNAIGSKRTLTASTKLAARGQHVFNNGLLGFHRSVLEKLLTDVGGYHEQLKNLEQDLMIPLSRTEQTAINTTMVVHFSSKDNYVDYNAFVFGEYVRELREALVEYLKADTSVYKDDRYRIQKKKKRVQLIATQMVNHTVYEDPMACYHWLKEQKEKKQGEKSVQLYNQVRDALKNFKDILLVFKKVSDKIRVFRRRNNWKWNR